MRMSFPLFLCFLLGCTIGALAFSAYDVSGGAVHTGILREALIPEGVGEDSFYFLDEGLVQPDRFYGEEFTESPVHFTDMKLQEGSAHLEQSFQKLVEQAGGIEDDYQVYRETLHGLGNYLHTLHDFYSHTNWLELQLEQGATDPVPLAPINRAQDIEGLVSPFFLLRYVPPEENKDVEDYRRKFSRAFYSFEELDGLTDRGRLQVAARPQKAFIHRQLAKDDPSYPQAQVLLESTGKTLFEHARKLAVRHTVQQWKAFESRVMERYGPRRVELLRHGWTSSFPPSEPEADPPTMSLVSGLVEIDRALEIKVSLTMKPSRWDREGAQLATELFSDLTQRKRAAERVEPRGVEALSLRTENESTFHLAFEADLYGGAQTFVLLTPENRDRPEGPWVARITIFEEVFDFEDLEIRFAGGNPELLGSDGDTVRYRLPTPERGWAPPDWLEEYLEEY